MGYTEDIVLNVNCRQVKKERKLKNLFISLTKKIYRHKIITTIIFITAVISIFDLMLIRSFVDVLINI